MDFINFFLNFSICEYDEYIIGGETIILTGYKGYIDLSDYWGAFRLKIKVTVKGGYFHDNYIKVEEAFINLIAGILII